MTRNQLILFTVTGLFLLGAILVFTGILPGLRSTGDQPVELMVWGTIDRIASFDELTNAYRRARPSVTFIYRKFDEATYEQDVLDAFAAGRGPDIFMFHNTWLPKHRNKIVANDPTKLSLLSLQQYFPHVVENDFVSDGKIYALPLYIDTLALLYNKSILDNSGIALPPTTWAGVVSAIPKIRKISRSGAITRAAIALGADNKSVNNATDILGLTMLQRGATMTDRSFTSARFNSDEGLAAVKFYTQFTNPRSTTYTWNNALPSSLDAFAQEKVAMVIDYHHALPTIKEKNPFLNVTISPMPQFTDTPTNYADYFGLAVSVHSKFPAVAWDFIQAVTTSTNIMTRYLAAARHPPALRAMAGAFTNDAMLHVFAKQILTATSWKQIDNNAITNIFSDIINNIGSRKFSAQEALTLAQAAVNELMFRRR